MKTMRTWKYAVRLMGLLVVAPLASLGQTPNFIVNQLDTDTAAGFENAGWGTAFTSITWDGAVNQTTTLGPNVAGSGSAYWTTDWSATPGGSDQVMINHRFPENAVLDLMNYTNISFDIRFDPASATDGKGGFGGVQVIWTPQADGWASTYQNTVFFYTTNTGWLHVEVPFDASANAKLSAVTHVGFKIQQAQTGASLSGTTRFWIDNVILHGRAAQIPAPTIALAPVTSPPGLMTLAPGGGNDYRRGMIRTLDPVYVDPYYSWVGQGDTPVTYAITIASYPSGYSAMQSQIFLVPRGGNDSSVDWTAPTVMVLDIRDLPDGGGEAVVRYKVNHPSANASDHRPASLVCAEGVLGTWSLTFLNDTNVTITAPNGVSTNFALPETVPWEFYNPLTVYFGNQQNGPGNAGKAATYARVQITGAISADVDETFPGPDLNPDPENPRWQVVAEMPSCVFIVRPDHRWWARWTIPDTGFLLEGSASINGPWVRDAQWTNVIKTAHGNRLLLPESSLPAPHQSFFRMVQPGP